MVSEKTMTRKQAVNMVRRRGFEDRDKFHVKSRIRGPWRIVEVHRREAGHSIGVAATAVGDSWRAAAWAARVTR